MNNMRLRPLWPCSPDRAGGNVPREEQFSKAMEGLMEPTEGLHGHDGLPALHLRCPIVPAVQVVLNEEPEP
jgi:hypothetical protein